MVLNCSCNYCIKKKYLWVLEDGRVWVEIPKNGSVTVKESIGRKKYPTTRQQLKSFNNGIVYLREPVSRFKSMLSHYFLDGARKEDGKRWLKSLGWNEKVSGDNIVDIVLNNWEELQYISEPHHFNLQYSFIPDEFWDLKKLEVKDISELGDIKRNTSVSNTIKLEGDNLDFILEVYREDVELYNHQILFKENRLN
jgi:hypothetical protein